MGRITLLFLLNILTFALVVLPTYASEIKLSAAVSMTNAFKDVADAFELVYPDVAVRLNFGSSGSLAKQIVHGAPADIFVSANPKWMTFLGDKGKIDKNTVQVFAYNALVVVGTPEFSLTSLYDLTKAKRVAIGSPGSVPAGQYAREAMDHVGVYETLLNAKKLVMAKDARQAFLYADRKEVTLAFVYKTDALLAKAAKILYVVPPTFYDRVTYPIALTSTGVKNPSVKVFYDFIVRPEVGKIIEQYGFEVGPATKRFNFKRGHP